MKGAVLLSAAAALGFAAGMAGCDSEHTQVTQPPNTPAWLRAEATRAAAALGDKHPSSIRIFVGRYDKIVMHGRFRCPQCSRPAGAPVQTGKVVVIRIDPRTHKETDFGIGDFTGPDRTMT